MKISKNFTKSGSGNMTELALGHGVDFLTQTVRVTLHKGLNPAGLTPGVHMAHIALSPAEARAFAARLMMDAELIDPPISTAANIEAVIDKMLEAMPSRGQFFQIVKEYRRLTGSGLRESVAYVNNRQAALNMPITKNF